MPLPTGGGKWPPEPFLPVYNQFKEHAAWYSGDPAALSSVYGGAVLMDQYLGVPTISSQDRQGSLLRQKWKFWARRSTTIPFQRTRLHVPIASDMATISADLLFAKPPEFRIEDAHLAKGAKGRVGGLAAQDALDELLESMSFDSFLNEAAEKAAALGGVYLRVSYDPDFADHPFITAVESDSAIPEFRWGVLEAVTFWRVVSDDGDIVWRHLERHEKGKILHGLYEGGRNNLGELRPLTDQPATAPLAINDFVDGNSLETGVDMLTAVYVPNIRPNRSFRSTDLGRSDFQGTEGFMDALDEIYSSWMRDLRLGRARLIVPADWLRSNGVGKGAEFDSDQEIFTTLDGMPATEGSITNSQFAIRCAEHAAMADDFVNRIVSTAGYSYATFQAKSDQKVFPATATEIASREHRSLTTRNKKLTYWARPLADILEVMLQIDANVFGGVAGGHRPKVIFPDGVPAEPTVTATFVSLLAAAHAVSTKTKVMLVNPDWTPEAVDEEVKLILAADAASKPTPVVVAPTLPEPTLAAPTDTQDPGTPAAPSNNPNTPGASGNDGPAPDGPNF